MLFNYERLNIISIIRQLLPDPNLKTPILITINGIINLPNGLHLYCINVEVTNSITSNCANTSKDQFNTFLCYDTTKSLFFVPECTKDILGSGKYRIILFDYDISFDGKMFILGNSLSNCNLSLFTYRLQDDQIEKLNTDCKLIDNRDDRNILLIKNANNNKIYSRFSIIMKNFGKIAMDYDKRGLAMIGYLQWNGYYGIILNLIGIKLDSEKMVYTHNGNLMVNIKYETEFRLFPEGSYINGDYKEILKSNHGITPKISFSTPYVEVYHKKYGLVYLACGSIKIDIDNKYKPDSNLEKFKTSLQNDMKKHFKQRFVEYESSITSKTNTECRKYIGMIYFYYLHSIDLKGDTTSDADIFWSGAYLPFCLDKMGPIYPYDHNYKFSYVCPTGITKSCNNQIIVSCNEGEFYPIQLTFDIDEIMDLCIYDIKKTDMTKYQYKLLLQKKGITYIADRLEEVLKGSKYKYYKYRSKYHSLNNMDS